MIQTQHRIGQKPHLLKVTPPVNNSIIIKGDRIVNNAWHFHPEIEILYCVKAKGFNYVGNYISPIEEGEILVLGKNLPHTRKVDEEFYNLNPNAPIETILVQFKEDFLGDNFFNVKEFSHVKQFLEKSQKGLKLIGNTEKEIRNRLVKISNLGETAAILELLSILDIMARSEEFVFLNEDSYLKEVNSKDSKKINTIYSYTLQHFKEPIALTDVADLINLTPSAFCRYFKSRTRKSYFDYLSEVRISYACELLMENDLDISEVCFSSGFNSFSNFHKLFKRIVKLNPSEYREKSKRKHP